MPSRASATARLAATVDLPTPPLPEATATMRFTPGTAAGPACGVGWRPIFRSGGAAGFGAGPCAVSSAETPATPGSAATAASAARRIGSSVGPRAAIDLEDEADTLVLDGQRPDDVRLDDAPAGARHLDGAERREHGFASDAHRLLPTRIAAAAGRRLAILDRAPPGRRQGPAAGNRSGDPRFGPARFAIMFTRKLRFGHCSRRDRPGGLPQGQLKVYRL